MKIIVSCGFALAMLGTLAIEVAAQSSGSCRGEYALCQSRGGGSNCDARLASCRRTGCWQHIPKWGGQRYCNLKKS